MENGLGHCYESWIVEPSRAIDAAQRSVQCVAQRYFKNRESTIERRTEANVPNIKIQRTLNIEAAHSRKVKTEA
jgi:hypothetical protein